MCNIRREGEGVLRGPLAATHIHVPYTYLEHQGGGEGLCCPFPPLAKAFPRQIQKHRPPCQLRSVSVTTPPPPVVGVQCRELSHILNLKTVKQPNDCVST